jgi:hypothetical protein
VKIVIGGATPIEWQKSSLDKTKVRRTSRAEKRERQTTVLVRTSESEEGQQAGAVSKLRSWLCCLQLGILCVRVCAPQPDEPAGEHNNKQRFVFLSVGRKPYLFKKADVIARGKEKIK